MEFFQNKKPRGNSLLQTQAAELLVAGGALMSLSISDALVVVSYMHPRRVQAGEVLIREGESKGNDFMALLIEGEVTVESCATTAQRDSMVVTVLGPGSLVGELGIIDDEPRSASCIASTDLLLAILPRAAVEQLIEDEPAVAARLMLAVAKSVADHLRETNRKLVRFSQMTKALQEELGAVHSVNRRLLERASVAASAAAADKPPASN
ncbi:MAG: cyclic nucleotide-binding domain-containing protein [Burkholderiaceae bacterium]|jgi:CRP-like cAMP-binding protein|nr:cyclic nucleotide-binding domain-containing protein [Burkholderiaceae bacterium]